MSRRPNSLGKTAGVTLVEMLVVLFIIAGLAGGGIYAIGLLTHSNLKDESMRLASTVQYTYEQAALNNHQYRLIIDLDTNEYYTEVTADDVVIDADSDQAERAHDQGLLPEELAQREAEENRGRSDLFDDDEHDPFGISQRTGYQRAEDAIVEPRQLGNNIEFEQVYTEYRDRPVRDGRAAVHFFPNGLQQQAYIVVVDPSTGAKYTLITEPMTGRVRIYSGDRELPEDFGEEEEYRG